MNIKDIIKLGAFLMIAAAIAGIALSVTYIFTAPKIEEQKKLEINRALKEVLPEATEFKRVTKTVKDKTETFYIGLKDNLKIGAAFIMSPTGYSGPIEMMVGIDNRGIISGVKIISIKETPGLGMNAEGPKFLEQFKGKSEKDKLKAKLDIQAITGATITSQSVANGVREALEKFKIYY